MSVSTSPLDQLSEYTRTLEGSRAALDPEIFAPIDSGSEVIGRGTVVAGQTFADRDVAMYDLMQTAQKRAETIKSAYQTGETISMNGQPLSVDDALKVSIGPARARLKAYAAESAKSGGRVFQFLEDGLRQRESKRWRENLPMLAQLFSGPATMADKMPQADRAAFEDSFKLSLDPDRDKMVAANMRLVAEMTGKSIDEISPAWDAVRSKYAQQAFGLSGVVDDTTFYQAAGKQLTKEKTDGELLAKIHARASVLALQGKPLAESLAEAKKLVGDRLPEFAPAVRQGHASALARFSDEEIKIADTLWNEFQRGQFEKGKSKSDESPDAAIAMVQYGRMDQAKRENLLGILALRAQDEGEDVKSYFARLGAAVKSGNYMIATGLAASTANMRAKKAVELLASGEVTDGPTIENVMKGVNGAPSASDVFNTPEGKKRKITADERRYLENARDFQKGQQAFLTDLPNAGIKSKRYLQDNAEGLDRFLNWSVMAAESLPLMASAAAPGGVGLLMNAAAYQESNLAQLRKENPGMDNATMERTAYTSGLLMAGVDRLQINLMGAKLPKLQAWAFRQKKLLSVPGIFAARAGIAGGAEFGQEIVQDMTLPAMSELVSVLSDEIQGPNWKEVIAKEKAALGDIAGVSLLFGIIGGAGRAIGDVVSLPKLKEMLTDRQGLAVAGFTPETIEAVATEAETNPLAAAEALKAAAIETPADVRKANSKAAVEAQKANPPPTAQEAALPEIIQGEDGNITVKYPDGTEDVATSMDDAFAALRVWEQDDSNIQEQGIRGLLKFFEGYHEGNAELGVKGIYTGKEISFADWAKGSSERMAQAYARVRILMRDEFTAGRAATDGSAMADADIDLSQFLILGSSQNTFAAGVTRIAIKVANAQQGTKRAGATVLTPIEEHAEGLFKWMMDSGKKSEAWFIQQIREVEANTKAGQTMASNLMELTPELRRQEVIEALSRLAVANATGKVQDSQLSAGIKAIFRALKEAFKAILELAADIAAFRQSGKMDSEFAYWLDVAGGMSEDYYGENMVRQMEADMIAESMEGMPEIKSAIAGKLPHPETLRANGHPLAGEVAALYDEIKQSEDSGANQSARTRKANEFFLPPGEMVDLDKVRESLNQQGFDFQTPADMLDAAMLSVGYRKPQYAIASTGMESFSVGRGAITPLPEFIKGSKVVDQAGNPLVVYHGSPDIRNILKNGFTIPTHRQAIFFVDAAPVAETYADDRRAMDYQNAEPHVIPAYLSITNPLEIDAKGKRWRETEKHVAAALDAGHDGIIIRNSRDEYNDTNGTGRMATVYAVFSNDQVKSAATSSFRSRVDGIDLGLPQSFSIGRDRPKNKVAPKEAFASAIEKFGLTNDIAEAGYILPDGKLLDFSGRAQAGFVRQGDRYVTGDGSRDWMKGSRGVDHREIKWDGMPEYKETWMPMVEFMAMGAVRVDKSGAITLHGRQGITSAQKSRLADLLIESGGEAYVDMEDDDGKRAAIGMSNAKIGKLAGFVQRWKDGWTPDDYIESFSIARVTPAMDREYLAAVEADDMETAQRMVDDRLKEVGALWHGTPSGDLRGGRTGLHVGTRQASMEALEARIGIPADGKGWNGDREYGKTLLAGKDRINSGQFGKYRLSGFNTYAPKEDYYPSKMPTVGEGVPVDPKWKPWLRPIMVVGEMTNNKWNPISDAAANRRIKRKLGAYYTNTGEDSGSISAVLPDGEHIRVKLADPVTRDSSGNVIPLSQRFNPNDDRISFSIARADSPLIQAIDALVVAPEVKAEVFKRMAAKVRDIRQRFDRKRLTSPLIDLLEDDPNARFESLKDLATLEAVAKVLPPAIRGKLVGSFRAVNALKTAKGREDYMIRLLPKIEQALETHLQNQFRMAIRREFDRGAIKVSESKTRGGKIGAVAHAIFEEARTAMKLKPEQAEATAEKYQNELETADSLTPERLEELDGKIAALQLFNDFENADSMRLEEALKLLRDVYRDGRREWLEVLGARRELRLGRIDALKKGLALDRRIDAADINRAAERDKGTLKKLDEGFMEFMTSNSQKIRRLAELTGDPASVAVLEEFEGAVLDAELAEGDMNHADQQALAAAMRRIFKVNSEWGVAAKLRELSDGGKETDQVPVTKLEGFKEEPISVPKNLVESLIRGEVSGFTLEDGTAVELDAYDVAALEEAWDMFSEMEEADQNRRQMVRFTRRVSGGVRRSLGPLSQLNGLQVWLTMRQPDQGKKMETIGYDAETMAELEAWLLPETKAIGMWMVDYLKADQGTLDGIHRAEKGVGLGLVENYFPIRNFVAGADNTALGLDGNPQMTGGKSVSALKERVINYANLASVNAIGTFLNTRGQVNFWKAHVSTMREWGGVIRDDGMAAAIKVRMGETYFQSLKRMMERIESGGSLAKGSPMFDRMVKQIMKTNALGVLGMRASTIWINFTAALNVMWEIRADKLVKGMLQVMKRPEAFKDAWNSPAIRRRLEQGATFEAQIAKAKGPSSHPLMAILNRTAERGMFPIQLADTGANLIGAAVVWESTRADAVAAGMDDATARTMADAKVERVLMRAAQPTTRIAKSEMEQRALDHPIGALFALFVSEPRKNLANTYMAMRELATGKGNAGKAMAAQQSILGLIAIPAVTYLAKSLFQSFFKAKDDEEDEILARFLAKMEDSKAWSNEFAVGHFKGIPLFGDAWAAAVAKATDQPVFNSSPNPLLKAGETVYNVPDAFGDVTPEQRSKAWIKITQGLGRVVPGGAVFAQGGNVAEFGMNAATSNGVAFSDEDRARRIKARYQAASKALDEKLGKTTGADGKINKDIQATKQKALADKLRAELAPLDEKTRAAVLKEKIAPDSVVEAASK